MVRLLVSALALAWLAGAFEARAGAPVSLPQAAPAFASSGDPAFDAWRAAFATQAVAAGRPPAVVAQVLAPLAPDPRVVAQDRNQPEFVRPAWEYVERAVHPDRVANGRRLRAEQAALFAAVEARYGVDADVIAGIWGMETNFGRAPLPHDAARAIATLAAEGRRRDQFETYLLALIDMVAAGYAGPEELRSSWAGALGQPQFMPDVYLTDAVDWNGDGRRDIWREPGDVFASVANYLVRRGWKPGQPVFHEVRLPAGFDYGAADGRRWSVAVWSELGVARIDGTAFAEDVRPLEAELFLPAGAAGPALLLYDNFRAIRAYNPSDRYSLAVALLADAFEGGPGLRRAWPRAQGALQKADMARVQELLAARGFFTSNVDGVFGARTRAALRAWQRAEGLPADGWATPATLARLEQAAAAPLDAAGITRLQEVFVRLGAPLGRPTGSVGPRTRAAIERLEAELGAAVTGAATTYILAKAEEKLMRAPPARAPAARRRR